MVSIFLCAFLCIIILHGQESDTSITISYFMNPIIEGIPIILDESGQNTFFLDTHYPKILNDYSINHAMVDGSLHLPRGSYFLPALLPKGSAPDSINNYSQIHYRKGDYHSGELGLSLQIEGVDSSYFTLRGFSQSPAIVDKDPNLENYSYSSPNDNLQNYLLSYNHLAKNTSISVDVLYHMEDYHLPLVSYTEFGIYRREIESFHGGLAINKKWGNCLIDIDPAFQLTHANRHNSVTTFFTVWNRFGLKVDTGNHFKISVKQQSKIMTAEKDSQLSKIETHIFKPKLQYHSGGIILEGGAALYNRIFEPEGKASWKYKHIYLAAGREFHMSFLPEQIAEYENIKYYISYINIGYIHKTLKITLEIFQVEDLGSQSPGISGKIDINLPWMRLEQRAGIYNLNSDDDMPIDRFNHIELLFSPNLWRWRTARYQPFMGLESFYVQHSGRTDIDPINVPIFVDSNSESYGSHLINMELGFLINRFKVSYRWGNILGNLVQGSSQTYPIQPVNQLVVAWQFLN